MSASTTRRAAAGVAGDDRVADSPYVGLISYSEQDADVFFGRGAESQVIIGNLRASRLTVLYASSGAGKSSLLRAGVAAKLRRQAMHTGDEQGSHRYVPVVFASWRDDPIADLRKEIEAAIRPLVPAGTPTDLPVSSLADALQAASRITDATLLIILDQFEEYLLYRSISGGEQPLADELTRCMSRRELRANFLIAIREDAYAGLGDLFRGRLANVYGNTLHLENLGRNAARETIEKPLEHFNATHVDEQPMEIEPALLETVLSEVRIGQVSLEHAAHGLAGGERASPRGSDAIEAPYMQLVMTRLWEQERAEHSPTLRLSTLEELGGSQNIVQTHLDRALAELDRDERNTAAEVFLHLVTPSGAKIANSISDLASWSGCRPEQVESLIEHLAGSDQRIVRPLPPAAGSDSPRVEIYHDVLAGAILDWCQSQTEARLRRERNAARRRVALVAALALVALGLAAFALVQRQRAVRDLAHAHLAISSELAVRSGDLLTSGDISLAGLLSLKAYAVDPIEEARAAINEVLQQPLNRILSNDSPVQQIAFSPDGKLLASGDQGGNLVLWNLATHSRAGPPLPVGSPVIAVAFSPDGKLVATGDAGGTIVLWDVASRTPAARTLTDGSRVESVAFSPDDHMLASGDAAGNVKLWGVSAGRLIGTPLAEHSAVHAVAFSPDGSKLAAGDKAGDVTLWSLASHSSEGAPFEYHDPVYSVAFSPVGDLLASGDEAGHVAVRNLATRALIGPPIEAGSAALSIAFNPNGALLASGDQAGHVRLWSVASHLEVVPALGDGSEVTSVAFDPDGKTVASGTNAGSIVLWNVAPRAQVGTAIDVGSAALSVDFRPDGKTIASGTEAGQVVLLGVAPPSRVGLLRVESQVRSVAFSPNGELLATGDVSGHLRLWNVVTHAQVGTGLDVGGAVNGVAFSPDGRTLASGDQAGKLVLWNVVTHTQAGEPIDVGSPIQSVAFSPDGKTVAGGGQQGIELRSVATHAQLGATLNAGSDVLSVAFSPDGRTLASGDAAGTIALWNVATHAYIGKYVGGEVLSVAFSPLGKTLAAGDSDGSIVLFDSTNGLRIGRIPGDLYPVESLAFSPNGELLAAGDQGGNVVQYSPLFVRDSFTALRSTLCSELGTNLTRAQWTEYIPGEPYDDHLCPGYP